tara:strand:+ start:280 stop:675 length:396 start_codon:yes stop_codon:yes gene_type:complete
MTKETKKFSKAWKGSKKVSKQRKFQLNAPLHLRHKFVRALLSKDLRKKHNKRNLSINKGDKVKIMRGNFRKKEGKVDRVDLKKKRIYVNGLEIIKRDGTKVQKFVHPSNLMIMELKLGDKQRQKIIDRKGK